MGEALQLLARDDINDVLVASPTVLPTALDRACHAIAQGNAITLTVDATPHLQPIAAAAERAGATAPVVVEADVFGDLPIFGGPNRRTAIDNIDSLLQLAAAIADTQRLQFRGVAAFETRRSHLAAASRNARRQPEHSASQRQVDKLHARRHRVAAALKAHGHAVELFTCDGNDAPAMNALDGSITEMTVGDVLYGLDPSDSEHTAAAGLAVEISRQPGRSLYACLSGGIVCANTAAPGMLPKPISPPGATLDSLYGTGGHQLAIRYSGQLAIGDVLCMLPANASELAQRFGRLVLIQDNTVVGEAATLRALHD